MLLEEAWLKDLQGDVYRYSMQYVLVWLNYCCYFEFLHTVKQKCACDDKVKWFSIATVFFFIVESVGFGA